MGRGRPKQAALLPFLERTKSERAEAMQSIKGEHWTKLKKQGALNIVNDLLERLLPEAPKCETPR